MNFLEYIWIRGIQKIPSEYKNCRRNTKKFSDYRWIHGNSPEFKLNSWEYNVFFWIRLNSRNKENTVRIQELQKECKKVLWLQMNTREFTRIQTEFGGIQWICSRRGSDEYVWIHMNTVWLCMNSLEFARIFRNSHEYVGIHTIRWNSHEYVGIHWNSLEYGGIH